MNTRQEKMIAAYRVFSLVLAFALLVVSVQFSKDGFGFEVQGYDAVGVILALTCTLLQSLLQSADTVKLSPILWIAGILAYVYGISVNFVAITHAQGVWQNFGGIADFIMANPGRAMFDIILSVAIDVLPEPLIALAITGGRDSDVLSNVVSLFADTRGGGGGRKARGFSGQQRDWANMQGHSPRAGRDFSR